MLGLGSSLTADYKPVFLDDYSIQLDGTDDYIQLDNITGVDNWDEIHNAGSVSIWVKINTTSSTGQIFRMQADSNNFISMYYHAGTNTTRTAYKGSGGTTIAKTAAAIENDGNWHHLVSTWSTTTNKISIYLDGTIVEAKPNSGSLDTFSGDIAAVDIGQNTSGSSYFDGYVNDCSIWNKALTGANISAIYNNGKPNDVATLTDLEPAAYLIGYYKFETGSGTSVTDHSKYRNAVTLVNEPTWSTDTP